MARKEIKTKEMNGTKFPYIEIGGGGHYRPERIYVSAKLISKDEKGKEYIKFPIRAYIHKTERGTLVLRPHNTHIIYYVYAPRGYRGRGMAEPLTSIVNKAEDYYYHSPRGSLGASHEVLYETDGRDLYVRIKRTGRLYGAPSSYILHLTPDGKEEEIEELPDGLEELQEKFSGGIVMRRQIIDKCTQCGLPIYWGDRYITVVIHEWTYDDNGNSYPNDAYMYLHPICFMRLTWHTLLDALHSLLNM